MKFGSTDDPGSIDFTLPPDHKGTHDLLHSLEKKNKTEIFIGCAKWNKQDLKGFYPPGTKDELAYYSTQFNSIEHNATFYRMLTSEQIRTWKEKTPDGFKFFPKIPQLISHIKRINNAEEIVDEYTLGIREFEEKLGAVFLQLPDNFKTVHLKRLKQFVQYFPSDIPLAVELRNTEWFADEDVEEEIYSFFEANNTINIITDTAGRRDLLHMRLTTPNAFIRYVGANHPSDYDRLDDWFDRIKMWSEQGLQSLYFFVHQNLEQQSPLLSAYLIERLNKELGYNLTIPNAGLGQLGLGL